ncbi:MAG: N-6 DNA methylase [Deferribacteraceae bacterium]|jgi:hypothetical protein|nr:N-6 DNA methylase [Deferribacteraceae bacterium]
MKIGCSSTQSAAQKIADVLHEIIYRHISEFPAADERTLRIDEIFKALHNMLNGSFEKYRFDKEVIEGLIDASLSEQQFHSILHSLNEKQAIRKINGIYNTPNDVVDFIIANVISQNSASVYSSTSKFEDIAPLNKFLEQSVLDPTVGSGEFLLRAFQIKANHLQTFTDAPTEKSYLDILSTLYGNDIDISAIEICKVRLFFEVIKYIGFKNYTNAVKILNKNFTNHDFINITPVKILKCFDLIVGNPPYIEDNKSPVAPNIRYGNIYANVLQNSIDLLNENGAIGFIIPISYISTQRMGTIRTYIEEHTTSQKIFNFADRPSCLFAGVHQKLSIIIAHKAEGNHKVYTSNYTYWYKNERKGLFDKLTLTENNYTAAFYPKLSSELEIKIYSKLHTEGIDGLSSYITDGKANIYLNMRACFWIKAFSFPFNSKEFKGYSFGRNIKWQILALLNSSLFWLHWILISDCWHITQKELDGFSVPKSVLNSANLAQLAIELERELERTKTAINTKQTDFEYKHKLCRTLIDKIDDCLSEHYGLISEELNYIKTFAKKYREGLGAEG